MPPITALGVPAALTDVSHSSHSGSTSLAPYPKGAEGSFAEMLNLAKSRQAPLTGTVSNPAHIPINPPTQTQRGHDFQEKMLGLRSHRQQLIASNIANADTPHYKAVDIDIQEVLDAESNPGQPPLPLRLTSPRHLPGLTPSQPAIPIKYHNPLQPNADDNTVEMDVERAKFVENSGKIEFAMDRVSSHFKMMMELLKSQ